MFIDECNIARNLAERGPIDFFKPLDYEQYAPPLFLCLQDFIVYLLGMNEYALRLWPLIASILGLLVFYRITLELKLSHWAWFPLTLMGFTEFFFLYASELKQYTTDLLISQLLLLLALKIKPKEFDSKHGLVWLFIGVIAPWISMPSVFVLAGVGFYYLASFGTKRILKSHLQISGAILCWLLSFLAYYLLILNKDIGTDYLANTHQGYFLDLPPTNLWELKQWAKRLQGILGSLVGFKAIPIVGLALFMATGLWKLLWSGSRFLLLASPVILCLLAAGLKQYSLMPRLTFFFLPFLWIIALLGCQMLWERGKKWSTYLLIVWMLITAALNLDLQYLTTPLKREEARAALKYLHDHKTEREKVILHHGAVPVYSFYNHYHDDSTQYKFAPVIKANWEDQRANFEPYLAEREEPFWILYTNMPRRDKHRIDQLLMQTHKAELVLSDRGCSLWKLPFSPSQEP